jgi:hypothetical protein
MTRSEGRIQTEYQQPMGFTVAILGTSRVYPASRHSFWSTMLYTDSTLFEALRNLYQWKI